MRFGLNLLNFGPDASPRSIDAWGRLAEEAGFSFLTISDHVAITDDVFVEYQTPFYDPLVTLAYLAAATERVRLGTSVLVAPYRHPLLIARTAANIAPVSPMPRPTVNRMVAVNVRARSRLRTQIFVSCTMSLKRK